MLTRVFEYIKAICTSLKYIFDVHILFPHVKVQSQGHLISQMFGSSIWFRVGTYESTEGGNKKYATAIWLFCSRKVTYLSNRIISTESIPIKHLNVKHSLGYFFIRIVLIRFIILRSNEVICMIISNDLLWKASVSFQIGLSVFLLTLVSNLFFLSGSRHTYAIFKMTPTFNLRYVGVFLTLTKGSEVPPMSMAGILSAFTILTKSVCEPKSYESENFIVPRPYVFCCSF